MQVTLNSHEVGAAVRVGALRHWEAVRGGMADRHGFDGDGWGVHIEGALGEIAAAKALNIYWDGSVNTFKADDLAGIQVRTRSRADYELIVRPGDDDGAAWVLVTGKHGKYDVRGWIKGDDAKRDEWLAAHGNRPAAYFVPHAALKPIEELRK
jgi:hypothetical protein